MIHFKIMFKKIKKICKPTSSIISRWLHGYMDQIAFRTKPYTDSKPVWLRVKQTSFYAALWKTNHKNKKTKTTLRELQTLFVNTREPISYYVAPINFEMHIFLFFECTLKGFMVSQPAILSPLISYHRLSYDLFVFFVFFQLPQEKSAGSVQTNGSFWPFLDR